MIVTVDTVEYSGGTVATGEGTLEDGTRVKFGGDVRAMAALADIVAADGPTDADIALWQILAVYSEPKPTVTVWAGAVILEPGDSGYHNPGTCRPLCERCYQRLGGV